MMRAGDGFIDTSSGVSTPGSQGQVPGVPFKSAFQGGSERPLRLKAEAGQTEAKGTGTV